jgi:regulatory protein
MLSALNGNSLRALALTYTARYATTRGKLIQYLTRKLRERGWDDVEDADPKAIAEHFVELGYIDDEAFARMKAGALRRRGLGSMRIGIALKNAGIATDLAVQESRVEPEAAFLIALHFARRKRIGPFAHVARDERMERRWMGAFMRAGHRSEDCRRIMSLTLEEATSVEETAILHDDDKSR